MSEIEVRTTNYCLVSGRLAVIGEPYFDEVATFGLEPGTKVSAVGRPAASGKQTSSCRMDHYKPYAIYMGQLQYWGPESVKQYRGRVFAAFDISAGVTGWKPGQEQKRVFGLYLVTETELLVPLVESGSIRIYQPAFELYKVQGDLFQAPVASAGQSLSERNLERFFAGMKEDKKPVQKKRGRPSGKASKRTGNLRSERFEMRCSPAFKKILGLIHEQGRNQAGRSAADILHSLLAGMAFQELDTADSTTFKLIGEICALNALV